VALVPVSGPLSGNTAGRIASPTLNLRILLVEDHADSRRVLGKLLESFGCVVKTAGTVAEALAASEHESFDVLVSDIGLPDGSGMDIMRQMRTKQRIKGIALSGFGQAEDFRRSEEAGFEVHLTKPVSFRALQDVIEKVAR
jgi:CheY-like chemotaxis protein